MKLVGSSDISYAFVLSDAVLRKLCQLQQIPLNEEENLLFFGLRGSRLALPEYERAYSFQQEHLIQLSSTDYLHPRCLLGQWLPSEKKLAVFPGSTVPNLAYVLQNRKSRYEYNCMVYGSYVYEKSIHPSDNSFEPHPAFRMLEQAVFQLDHYTCTADQQYVISYQEDATTEVGYAGNQIHSARNNPRKTLNLPFRDASYSSRFCLEDYYSSFGCQVIVGQPEAYIPSGYYNGTWNAWHYFQHYAYESITPSQKRFRYLLWPAAEAFAITNGHSMPVLRYGSSGENVKILQKALHQHYQPLTGKAFYTGEVDGIYGAETAKAVIRFQKVAFGGKAKGWVDPSTQKYLGIHMCTTPY